MSAKSVTRLLLAAAFVGTVYAANWSLQRWGEITLPVIGLSATAGVWAAGLAFGLRDAMHESAGRHWRRWVIGSILVGAVASYVVSDAVSIPGGHAPIAVASGVAFLLSELADLAVYQPLRERQWVAAVVASNIVGGLIDSALFVWLAFGSFDTVWGQTLGKWAMIAVALPVVWAVRRR